MSESQMCTVYHDHFHKGKTITEASLFRDVHNTQVGQ